MWQTEKLPYHYFGLDAIFFLYSVAVNEIKNPQRDFNKPPKHDISKRHGILLSSFLFWIWRYHKYLY